MIRLQIGEPFVVSTIIVIIIPFIIPLFLAHAAKILLVVGKETTHPIPFVFIMHMCCYIVVFAKTRQDPPEQSRTAICKEGKGSIVVSAKNIHFDTS